MLAKRGPAAERYKFLLWAYILPTVATRGDMSAALCAMTEAHTWPHGVLQPSASGPLIGRGKTVSGLHGSAVLVQCGSADVGPIKYGRACPVPRRRGRPGGGPLWEFEIGPPLGQRDIAVWVIISATISAVECIVLFPTNGSTPSGPSARVYLVPMASSMIS